MNSRWLAYALVVFGLFSFGYACKGGGDGSGNFIEVLETTPFDGQGEVPTETRIGFRVNAPIDPASLTTQTFFVTDDQGTSVPGSVVIGAEPDIAELVTDEPLAVITGFTAAITTGLLSTSGATLETDFTWDFSTLDSAWGVSEWLEETSTGTADKQQIVVDAQSNALAIWEYTQAAGSRIWANRYTRTNLWGEPERIDTGDGDSANPSLATDDAGNGFAVWEEDDGSGIRANIWTSRYTADVGWGTPALLQSDEVTPARFPSVAADPDGNAIAVWVQVAESSADELIWASRYDAAIGDWGPAAPIDDMPAPLAGRTGVGMDDAGNAIAIWSRGTAFGGEIWANRYTAGLGWGTAELIKSDPATDARGARLHVASNGDAFVVWVQNEGDRDDVWSARFSGTWSAPERIETHDGNKAQPDIAVDGMGIAHAVWSQSDLDFLNIWANQYTPGTGWGTAELIEQPIVDEEGDPLPAEDGDATTPRVGVNDAGNAFVVWRQIWEDWGSIWSNRLDPGTGWMTEELIEDIERPGKAPKVAVDDQRHAHAVWLHFRDTGIDWVRTNRFE